MHSDSRARIEQIKQRAIAANKSRIKVIDKPIAQPASYFPAKPKSKIKTTQEEGGMVDFHNSVQMQKFRSFVAHAENVLEEYHQHLLRDTTKDNDPNWASDKRLSELEFHNRELKQKCAYLSSKNKVLLSKLSKNTLHDEMIRNEESMETGNQIASLKKDRYEFEN